MTDATWTAATSQLCCSRFSFRHMTELIKRDTSTSRSRAIPLKRGKSDRYIHDENDFNQS